MFPKNMGAEDRGLRLIAAVVLIPVGLFVLGGMSLSIIGLVAVALGAIGLVTAIVGRCPTYVLLGGIDTHRKHYVGPVAAH